MRQIRVDHSGTGGKRLGVLDAWRGEVGCLVRGVCWYYHKTNEGRFLSLGLKTKPEGRHNEDGIWVHPGALKQRVRGMIAGLRRR